MYYNENLPVLEDPRELSRQNDLRREIENGNQFATGELNFRIVQAQRGMNFDQIEQAIDNFFAAPF